MPWPTCVRAAALLVVHCCCMTQSTALLCGMACRVHQPLRQCLGWVLLHVGRLDEAAAVYKQVGAAPVPPPPTQQAARSSKAYLPATPGMRCCGKLFIAHAHAQMVIHIVACWAAADHACVTARSLNADSCQPSPACIQYILHLYIHTVPGTHKMPNTDWGTSICTKQSMHEC